MDHFLDRPSVVLPGRTLSVTSSYRSFATQCALFAQNADIFGEAQADTFSARPGHSEHQLGTTVDLYAGRGSFLGGPYDVDPDSGSPAPADPVLYRWVDTESWRFGFINSYPPNTSDDLQNFPDGSQTYQDTGYKVEPWHFRFVGLSAARIHRYYYWITGQRLSATKFVDLLQGKGSRNEQLRLEQALEATQVRLDESQAPNSLSARDQAAIQRAQKNHCYSQTYQRPIPEGRCVVVRACELWQCRSDHWERIAPEQRDQCQERLRIKRAEDPSCLES